MKGHKTRFASPDWRELYSLAETLGATLKQKNLLLTTAESCSGGLVSAAITSVAGSSQWFERGFVTYSNESKQEMLNVPREIIQTHGAVSKETAIAMAQGAIDNSHAQISLSITGIAGPDGGSKDKPVGTVWHAWQGAGINKTSHKIYNGDRNAIRYAAAAYALETLLAELG